MTKRFNNLIVETQTIAHNRLHSVPRILAERSGAPWVRKFGNLCIQEILAREQALCLGKNSEEREGKGGERACRQTFEAAIPPSCNYLAEHLSVRSLSVNQFRA